MSIIANSTLADCLELPFEGGPFQSAHVSVDGKHVVVGLPEIGRAVVLSVDLMQALELRPPASDMFAEGRGFGASVAVDGETVAVGAFRTSEHRSGVEQPAGVFHSGAVYIFDLSSGALHWRAMSDSEQVFGHSLAFHEQGIAFGVYEVPGSDGGSVRLRSAARGAIALRSQDGAPLDIIAGPENARGFGAELSGDGRLITSAARTDILGIWTIQDKTPLELASMPLMLNGIEASYVAAASSTVAVSAGGGFDAEAGRTRFLAADSETYEISVGGPLALSEHRLSVLVHAAPEGPQHNRLIVYDVSSNGAPVEVTKINHVIGAAVDERRVFAILAEPGTPLKLCRVKT